MLQIEHNDANSSINTQLRLNYTHILNLFLWFQELNLHRYITLPKKKDCGPFKFHF